MTYKVLIYCSVMAQVLHKLWNLRTSFNRIVFGSSKVVSRYESYQNVVGNGREKNVVG